MRFWLSRLFDALARQIEGPPRASGRSTYYVRSTDGHDLGWSATDDGVSWVLPLVIRKVDYATWRAAWVVDEAGVVVIYVAKWDVTARTMRGCTRRALRRRGIVLATQAAIV